MGETIMSSWVIPAVPVSPLSPHITTSSPATHISSSPHTHITITTPPLKGCDEDEETDSIVLLERRSFRPFKSSEDYLYAMREDLAEWLNGLYTLSVDVDNFFEKLETGVVLCKHANNVRRSAEEHKAKNPTLVRKNSSCKWDVPPYEVHHRPDAAIGSFFARDNIHNFIRWCRDLGVHEVLMFETDDLVLRKNEKHVILALLEIARRGAKFGMEAPLLVQMEADIDREMEADRLAEERLTRSVMEGGEEGEDSSWVEICHEEELEQKPPTLIYGPQPQIVTNDLKSLDEMVRELVARCTCPSQFPMVKVSEGKYRIGDTKVLIFVRILRNHVMVRVGGGWDTLQHYLDKHDPCRCRSGHRTTISSRYGMKNSHAGDRQLSSVCYERSEEGLTPGSPMNRRKVSGLRRESSEGRSSFRHRSQSPAFNGSPRLDARMNLTKEEPVVSSPEIWCDSSSEVSDEGYKSQGAPRPSPRMRRFSPKKPEGSDIIERPDSSMTQLSSEGSSVSTDDLGAPPSPPHSPSETTPANTSWTTNQETPKSKPSPTASQKSRFSFMDSLNIRFNSNKRPKKNSSPEVSRPAWNSGPGIKKPDSEFGLPRSRRGSTSEPPLERKISRSHSATSDGGFHNMLLRSELAGRQSLRTTHRRTPVGATQGKMTWNGSRRTRDYPSLNQETFRPPPVTKSVRSASASPAPARRRFPSSAPVTPVNRSPKRSAPATTLPSPSATLQNEVLSKLPDTSGDGDVQILAQLEELLNSYRTRVINKLTAEGLSVPPELEETISVGDLDSKESSSKKRSIPVKVALRKDGIGSRIPAPTYFKPKQPEI